ncbi:phosphocholine-specific phospholipase C [Aestuariivivens insulae]|uniref:phosphocholine-specific phospholipase C n=1 Tax=Aestuariivivens insulae TaxID=1621988 RepID=UPI001F564128|nr:phospholipase C, phosphocholine-specific [Aestuariivivens insulae]
MSTRRDFLKQAGLLTGGLGVVGSLPASVQRALSIDPEEGSTYEDAEHIVLLMQENRSFDHCFGTLRGVRGFNDPRAITLPNRNPVWLQSNKKGETYAPFRLDMKATRATWMGDLPHSFESQVDARNKGKYDNWLEAKRTHRKPYRDMPLTMGYYNREDIPFYYAFADAFTVFDQHFCSSLTGTTPNRNYFWSGKIRETPTSKPCVWNSDTYYNSEAKWKTYPERLEEHGISWRVYQNEISVQTGLTGEDEALLANFTDNNFEFFSQFNVRFSKSHQSFLKKRFSELPDEIGELEQQIKAQPKVATQKLRNQLVQKQNQLKKIKEELELWSPENYEKLSTFQKNIHERAFTTNSNDPHYHETESITFNDNGEERTMRVPKGDILHQFREDVNTNKLPTVSWLVAPQKFSDHPSAPWFGAWYVSEVLDILTKNPEVWKKTIFILTYDENDGYFDHVPPFVAPHPEQKHKTSKGIDVTSEYITMEDELEKRGVKPENARETPVGMGYRVPMVVASPWSRGGWVNSEVCDLTSPLQFMEKFLAKKTGKTIKETNISSWRRAISGDMTSAFRPFNPTALNFSEFVDRTPFMEDIYRASFKSPPSNFKPLSAGEMEKVRSGEHDLPYMPAQEPGIKDSCALPYELYIEDSIDRTNETFKLSFQAANQVFGNLASGAPFNVYAPGNYLQEDHSRIKHFKPVKAWAFAVEAGEQVEDTWPLSHFENGNYHLRAYGPNGFYREYKGSASDPELKIKCHFESVGRLLRKLSGNVELEIANTSGVDYRIEITDHAYNSPTVSHDVAKGDTIKVVLRSSDSYGWYDFSLRVVGIGTYERRFAGRVETGKASKTDPFMGRVI